MTDVTPHVLANAVMGKLYDVLTNGEFTFNIGDVDSFGSSRFDASGWSASAGGSFLGLFGAEGTASGHSSSFECTDSMNVDSFYLSFEIAQVPIVRPWFKEAFVTSKTWRFDPTNPDVKNTQVSDGGSPPTGIIAAYPTSAIFIRNLTLGIQQDSTWGQFIDKYQSSSQSGGGFGSFGPLFLGGTASHYSSSGYTQSAWHHDWNDQRLNVPGLQLAGFKCHIFPKCPTLTRASPAGCNQCRRRGEAETTPRRRILRNGS